MYSRLTLHGVPSVSRSGSPIGYPKVFLTINHIVLMYVFNVSLRSFSDLMFSVFSVIRCLPHTVPTTPLSLGSKPFLWQTKRCTDRAVRSSSWRPVCHFLPSSMSEPHPIPHPILHRGTRQPERNGSQSRKDLLRAVHGLQTATPHLNPAARLMPGYLLNHRLLSLHHPPHLTSLFIQLRALIPM
ncbi:hypothetical protein F4604DRAFT_49553 [Suillus subluteus]|nr:hypothetical protein F4604DRAFT_49553 [Suillus subluteus]